MMRGLLIRQWAIVGIAVALGVCLSGGETALAADNGAYLNLQQLINRTPKGGTLTLKSAEYEGAITIDKPIRIQAEGNVRLRNGANQSAVQIRADGVHVQGLQIVQEGREETAAVLVTASGAVLESLDIRTRSYGIVLRDGGRNEIRHTAIRWMDSPGQPAVKLSDKRNGIDLFNSHDNRIVDNYISSMNDGIYMENSHRIQVERNRIEHSRYGLHCMYIDGTVMRDNVGSYNVTGAMIMGVKDVEVTGNKFFKQSESVNSQGLLFFDVQTSRIFNNKVEGNRVGLYIEQSHRNEFRNNEVVQNFVGVQFLESEGNRFVSNRFTRNVIEAEASESKLNAFSGNYWEAFRGIDTNGDGSSELSYAINPFFQRLTSATPAYQLFFQSPGMLFLESMYTSGKAEWSVDKAPLMNPEIRSEAGDASSGSAGTLAAGLLLLFLSVFTILYLGVKRT